MVFLTKSSGYHLVKVNGKPIKNQSYDILMNKNQNPNKPNNEKVIINTNENNKKFSRNFNSLENFFNALNKNNGSIFNVTRNYHHKKLIQSRQNNKKTNKKPEKKTNKKFKSYSPPKNKNTRKRNLKKYNSF